MTTTPSVRRVLIGKSGLDGHDRGAKFISQALRDEGFEVIYTGIRRSPEEIVAVAIQEDVAVIGISSLSGAHLTLFKAVLDELKKNNIKDIPLIGGGVIPKEDIVALKSLGVKEIFTPGTSLKDIVLVFSQACTEHESSNA